MSMGGGGGGGRESRRTACGRTADGSGVGGRGAHGRSSRGSRRDRRALLPPHSEGCRRPAPGRRAPDCEGGSRRRLLCERLRRSACPGLGCQGWVIAPRRPWCPGLCAEDTVSGEGTTFQSAKENPVARRRAKPLHGGVLGCRFRCWFAFGEGGGCAKRLRLPQRRCEENQKTAKSPLPEG